VGFMVILTVLPLIRRVLAGLVQNGREGLVLPVRIYAAVTSLMLFSALVTMFRADWQATPAYLVSLGVVLFISSDVLLIWNKYIQPVRNSALWVTATYYFGQIMLVAGALGQFGNFQ
jgi:alkenylglycerophosphocholine hydrolase